VKSLRYWLLFLIFFQSLSYANDDTTQLANLSEDDYYVEIPQVLTISRLRQSPSNAPSASTIIDREMIRAAGIIDLPEIFRLVPGYYVGTNAGYITNTNYVVSYHGLTDAYSRRMQVLIDGRSVYQPFYGGVQWSELPITIEDIDRIEITRGPNAASYGANAFLAVINIITRDATGASFNAITDYRVTAGYKEDKGLSNRFDYKKTYLLNTRADYAIDENDSLEFQFGYSSGEREEGESVKDPLLFRPGRLKDIYNHYELIKWNHQFSPANAFYIEATHNYSAHDDTFISNSLAIYNTLLPIPLASNYKLINNDNTNERFNLELQHTITPIDSLKLAWGGSVRHDRVYAPLWLNNNKEQVFNLRRLFAQTEWQATNKLVMNAGTMIESNTFTGTHFTPRASLNYHFTPNQTLRIGASTATRTPSFLEQRFYSPITFQSINPSLAYTAQTFADNGNLKPERIVSREIGYLGQFDDVSLDLKLFNDQLSDLTESVSNTSFVAPIGYIGKPPDTFVNGGNLNMTGFEAQAKWSLTDNTKLLANYAHINVHASNGVDANFVNKYPKATAKNTASFLLTKRFNQGWDSSLAAYYSSPILGLGDGDYINANYRFDAKIGKRFFWNNKNGDASLIFYNLTDRHDHEYADYNTLRRRVFLNVSLDF
jgi:iron complex outermembrane recepter protein